MNLTVGCEICLKQTRFSIAPVLYNYKLSGRSKNNSIIEKRNYLKTYTRFNYKILDLFDIRRRYRSIIWETHSESKQIFYKGISIQMKMHANIFIPRKNVYSFSPQATFLEKSASSAFTFIYVDDICNEPSIS